MDHRDRMIADLLDRVEELAFRVAEQDRRIRNLIRFPRVTEVDAAKGLVKSIDSGGGEGKDLPLPFLPWMEFAGPQSGGNATTWRPPRVGQPMMLISPSGNLAEGFLLPGGFSNAAGQPSQSATDHVETNGSSSVTFGPNGIVYKANRIDFNPA